MQDLDCVEKLMYAEERVTEIKKELIKIRIGEIIFIVITYMILAFMFYAVFAPDLVPVPFNDIWFLSILLVLDLALCVQYIIHVRPSEKRRQLEIARAELMEILNKCNVKK